MSSDFYMGVYWGPRREAVDSCAIRLVTFLEEASRCDSAFTNWCKPRKSHADTSRRAVDYHSQDAMCALLNKGRNRYDSGHSVIEELGFSSHLWNGLSDDLAAGIMIGCGIYGEYSPPNAIVLDLPSKLGGFASAQASANLLAAAVKAWEPEWGGMISRESRERRARKVGDPVIDWIFYINRLDIDHSKLPASASMQPVDDLGTIIVVQEHPIDPTNPQDLENIRMVESALGFG